MWVIAIVMMGAMFLGMHGGSGLFGHKHDDKKASQQQVMQGDQEKEHGHGPATGGPEEVRSEEPSGPGSKDALPGDLKQEEKIQRI